jgi:hypothetical protein
MLTPHVKTINTIQVRQFHTTHDDVAQAVKHGRDNDIAGLMSVSEGILSEVRRPGF